MRWFKHLTLAHAHEDLSEVLEVGGAEAYGVWWLILEDVAALMDKGTTCPSATHSVVKWAQICHCSVRAFRSISHSLHEKSLIECQTTGERLRIVVRKLVKYRDEYSKKSGQTQDSRAETDTEVDTEGEKRRDQNGVHPPPNGLPPIEAGGAKQEQITLSPTPQEIPISSPIQEKLPIQSVPEQASNVFQMQQRSVVSQVATMQGAMVANGTPALNIKRDMDALLGINPLCDPDRDAWVDAAYQRHPKKSDIDEAYFALERIYRMGPAVRAQFDAHHAYKCKSEDWTEQNGKFCRKLHKYIKDGEWKQPVPKSEPKLDCPEVPELI